MGEEISHARFTDSDYREFSGRLDHETAILAGWFDEHRFADDDLWIGFELEAWLVDPEQAPAPINEVFLERLGHPLVTPELSKFNVELNGTPLRLQGHALTHLQAELESTWEACQREAHALGIQLVMIGILPTITESELNLKHISGMKRYRALNTEVMRQRGNRPIDIDICGRDTLRTSHNNVMLEAATTSFQLHMQVPASSATKYYNAMLALSGPLLSASGNSPFLFGRQLWEETRIPLFEQSVVPGISDGAGVRPDRVTFGNRFASDTLLEVFRENRDHYSVLLPALSDERQDRLPHLRLHNGTIWRWNRPLLGFNAEGRPHLRIEHRSLPSGPSFIDAFANAAMLFGAVHALVQETPDALMDFDSCRDNFYEAARYGLAADQHWGRHKMCAPDLLQQRLIPLAREGLSALHIDAGDADRLLEVYSERVRTGQTGAAWQRQCLEGLQGDVAGMTARYVEHQRTGQPVHEWERL